MSASTADALAVSVAAAPPPDDAIVAEVVVEKPEKPVRRFPPPCWTQEETLALIDAYRERWYALRRGYLRTADWDAVAAAVTSKCPNASPAKTSAQCRHKMEKLRQRYRAEKQRSLTYPTGRFFSSWFFFENMDAMENGIPVGGSASGQDSENPDVSGNGARMKTFLDQGSLKLKLNNKKSSKLDGDLASSYVYRGLNSSAKNVEVKVNSALNGYGSYMDIGSEKDEEEMDFRGSGVGGKIPEDGLYGAPVYKVKNFANAFVNPRSGFDGIDEASMPPRIRMKRCGRGTSSVGYDMGGNDQADPKDSLWASMGLKKKYGGVGNMEFDLLQSRGLNGFNGLPKMGFEKRVDGSGGEGKRGRSVIDDMVTAVKMLGEGFVKMETMKMDMAREIEKNRMEMEMKRNEMILESQRQIVDALAKGLMEVKRKKRKTSPAPEA